MPKPQWRPRWLDSVNRKIKAKIASEHRAQRRRRYSIEEMAIAVGTWRSQAHDRDRVNAIIDSLSAENLE